MNLTVEIVISNIAKDKGMKQIADAAGLGHESLYKALVYGAKTRV